MRLLVPTLMLGGLPPLLIDDPRDVPAAQFPGPVMDAESTRRIVALHNAERLAVRVPPLAWSERLARDALGWAQELARRGELDHAPDDRLHGEGENLFMGTAGAYSIDEMIGAFSEESADFQPGVFPRVARRGDWEDVGHYTQMIWPRTRLVGCAMARGEAMDVLVCRYLPAGNVYGERVP